LAAEAVVFPCFFVSDLHGRRERYETLWSLVARERPRAVFCGGDLLPHGLVDGDFCADFLLPGFDRLQRELGPDYPRVLLILGNDDPRSREPDVTAGARASLWEYIHRRKVALGPHTVYGYNCIPPTPFQLKDWERYDVSRYVDPGCVSPEQGRRSVPADTHTVRYATIAGDLAELTADDDLADAILLLHTPPYGCGLDRAALDGRQVDHVPVDPHVGSIAVQRLIAARQPLLTLHGHVHESTRLTKVWRENFGRTTAFTAAHDGPELALVRFDPGALAAASRQLIAAGGGRRPAD
jgi:Icc-related predicted phosphoesterase